MTAEPTKGRAAARQRSLRLSLSIWLLVPLLVLLALDAWLTYQRALHAANVAFDRTLFTSAKSIAEGVQLRNGQIQVDIPYLALEIFEANSQGRVFYRVAEDGGKLLTGYANLPQPKHPERVVSYQPVYYDAQYQGDTLRLIAMRLSVRDVATAQTRQVWVQVAETPELRRELAREILIGALLQEGLLILLAFVIVMLAISRGLRPLRKLSERVSARDEDDLSPLDESELRAELKPLVEALNQYVARIERMLTARRRFFADAAHQLKTPLAVMQAQAELALREDASPAVQGQLRGLLNTVKQASHGVKQLLSLSRLEPDSGSVVVLQPIELATVARDVALEWAPVARRKGVDLGFEQQATPMVEGKTELLQELIGNLVDNAIRYAGYGKQITVRVEQDGDTPMLKVIDNGPGIPPDEHDRVFLRFYRIPGMQVEGSGLGLAIVREIARQHGANLRLADTPGGGLTVELRFTGQVANGVGV
ncbi:sensor histidine kinase [Andreprevotia chitinilytica]|uniref:sensor histidine kinase n=1 Tax=Andreprevotia chitinilytica TaxID=396808 RepID=UPI000689ADF0|nr:sensor histidine kinase [Andreprevotia chitinilytica]